MRIEKKMFCFIKLNTKKDVSDENIYSIKYMLQRLHRINTFDLFLPYNFEVIFCIFESHTNILAQEVNAKKFKQMSSLIKKSLKKLIKNKNYISESCVKYDRIDANFASNISFSFINGFVSIEKEFTNLTNFEDFSYIDCELEEITNILDIKDIEKGWTGHNLHVYNIIQDYLAKNTK